MALFCGFFFVCFFVFLLFVIRFPMFKCTNAFFFRLIGCFPQPDRASFCGYFKRAGYCHHNSQYYRYMLMNCQTTCGFCYSKFLFAYFLHENHKRMKLTLSSEKVFTFLRLYWHFRWAIENCSDWNEFGRATNSNNACETTKNVQIHTSGGYL